MKRAHLQALTRALGGQTHLVASLHVLSQPTLEADDHAFLIQTSSSLHAIDLLRWLARCPSDGPRAHIIGRLAEDARRKPARFEAEVLGARLDSLQDEDWAELYEQLAPIAAPSLVQRLLARTSGCSVYRALLAARQERVADPCRSPQTLDSFALFEPSTVSEALRPALELARDLFAVRHDERACLRALREALLASNSPSRVIAAADAGVLPRVEDPLDLFPARVRFSWEHGDDEGAAGMDAAFRSVAAHQLGEAGVGWLASQVDAATERGVPVAAILGDLCPDALCAIWPRSLRLRGVIREACQGNAPERLRALRRLLPQEIVDAEILPRMLHSAPDDREAMFRAVTERASRTTDGSECAEMLGWLERREAPRHALFELVAGAIRRGVIGGDLLAWASSRLATRSSWERHGVGVLVALLERGAWSEMAELFAQCWSAAGSGDRKLVAGQEASGQEGEVSPAGFREAVHGAFALALLQLTRGALTAGQEAAALRALSALACLDPPSRLNSSLHELARRPDVSESVVELLVVNASLVKHGNGREASLQGVIAAVHVLSSR